MIAYYCNPAEVKTAPERIVRCCQAYEHKTGRAALVVHVPVGEGHHQVPGVRVLDRAAPWPPLRAGNYRVGGEETP